MKKSIYFLWTVLTVVIGGIWLSACSSDEPEPEIVVGYIFDIQISPLNNNGPFMINYGCAGLIYDGVLEHNASSFTFKADPTKNVNMQSLGLTFRDNDPEWMDFSNIKNGSYLFECGAKLTMISDTEFTVTDLPKFSITDNQPDIICIKMDMIPSQSFVSRDSEIVENKVFDREDKFPISIRLFRSYDLNK